MYFFFAKINFHLVPQVQNLEKTKTKNSTPWTANWHDTAAAMAAPSSQRALRKIAAGIIERIIYITRPKCQL